MASIRTIPPNNPAPAPGIEKPDKIREITNRWQSIFWMTEALSVILPSVWLCNAYQLSMKVIAVERGVGSPAKCTRVHVLSKRGGEVR